MLTRLINLSLAIFHFPISWLFYAIFSVLTTPTLITHPHFQRMTLLPILLMEKIAIRKEAPQIPAITTLNPSASIPAAFLLYFTLLLLYMLPITCCLPSYLGLGCSNSFLSLKVKIFIYTKVLSLTKN